MKSSLADDENLKTAMLAPVPERPRASAFVASLTSGAESPIEPDSSRTTATFNTWQAAVSASFAPGVFVVIETLWVASPLPLQLSLSKSLMVSCELPPTGGGNTCSLGPTLSGSGRARGGASLSDGLLSYSYSRVRVWLPFSSSSPWSTHRVTPALDQLVERQSDPLRFATIRMS